MGNREPEIKTAADPSGRDVVLSVKDLRTYLYTRQGVIKAVDGVSFDLHKNETLGIVGESGSGKSMTALSLLRMEPKPAGRIVSGQAWFEGENILEKSEKELREIRGGRISMILQDPQSSLNPVFTIGNQISEALRIHRQTGDREQTMQRVIGLLKKVQIAAPEQRVYDYPHQMSGGMKQRVVGAISISCSPQIVIADEPTTALDLTIQAQYLRLLRDIKEATGISIIFITHDFGVVARMCDRVAVMYSGRIVEEGSTQSIFERPSHPYTHGLINSVPKMETTIERLYSIPGQPPNPTALPTGCHFAPRCPYADERCLNDYPPRFEVGDDRPEHKANCWRLEDPTWKLKPS
jgi:oligopeptide/dipeptide ABC transporter ATP-binding protein